MSAPVRIQLRRAKGWRKPAGVVVVSRPSMWGNPFRVLSERREDRERAIVCFRKALALGLLSISAADVARELRGKDLACWCALPDAGQPDLCHAAVLLEFANAGSTP